MQIKQLTWLMFVTCVCVSLSHPPSLFLSVYLLHVCAHFPHGMFHFPIYTVMRWP